MSKKKNEDKTPVSPEEVAERIRQQMRDRLKNGPAKTDDDETAEQEEVEAGPPEDTFKITATILNPEATADPDGDPVKIVEGIAGRDAVRSTLQQLNSYRVQGLDIDVVIEDGNGVAYEPHDFGMPKPSRYTHRIAKEIGKVLDNPSRDKFEDLLLVMAMKSWKSWDVQDALDEVFGEFQPEVATEDTAFYDLTDEAVQRAQHNEADKADFLEALKSGILNK